MSRQTSINDLLPIPNSKQERAAFLRDDPKTDQDERNVWKVVTFVPRQQVHDIKGEPMKLMLMKIRRPAYYSKKDAAEAIEQYWSKKEPLLPHMYCQEGSWDAFLDEENRRIMTVDKNSYKTSDYVVRQVMDGFFEQNEKGRTDIEFRYDDSFTETKLWRKMKKWQHDIPEETDTEIRKPKQAAEKLRKQGQLQKQTRNEAKEFEDHVDQRQTMSEQRAKNKAKPDEFKTDEEIMDILQTLGKHKKQSLQDAQKQRKREQRRRHKRETKK